MAKHITKSVIEDIAYEIKRVGLITQAYENEVPTAEMQTNFGNVAEFDTTGTATLDWLAENIIDILATHDPTFDAERFRKQAAYKIEI